MNCGAVGRLSLIRIALVFLCLCVQPRLGLATYMSIGNMKADRILFLGNSITYVPYWGASATAIDRDYVHLLTSAIDASTGGTLALRNEYATPVTGVLVPSDGNIINIADIFERGYATYDASKLQQQFNDKPDIVVLQFGENIQMPSFDAVTFKARLESLVSDIENSGDMPNIFMPSYIMGANAAVDAVKRQVCAEDPTHRVYVDLTSMWQDQSLFLNGGHPNDQGHQVIANTLFAAMVAHSVPEPGSLTLLSLAGLFFVCMMWRCQRLIDSEVVKSPDSTAKHGRNGRVLLPSRPQNGSLAI
jgi:lysophospholipase L1-like esterase